MLTLIDYPRSSASFRVRIALHHKGIPFKTQELSLLEQQSPQWQEYIQMNPQGLVPMLITTTDERVVQSLNILEYLEKEYPTPSIYLKNETHNRQAKQIAYAICCDIHPLNNLRVLNYLKKQLEITEEQKQQWYKHWIMEGFFAIERWLEQNELKGNVCVGSDLSIADITLIPQVFNAKRFNVPLDNYPIINSIYEYCVELPAVKAAYPAPA